MEAIKVTSPVEPGTLSSITPGMANKPVTVAYNAYNNIGFRDILDSEAGTFRVQNGDKINHIPITQPSDAGHSTVASESLEQQYFLNGVKRQEQGYKYHPKVASKNFQALHVAKGHSVGGLGSTEETDRSVPGKNDLYPQQRVETSKEKGFVQQLKKYKEDQLLSNPGGDNFFLDREGNVIDNNYDHSSFAKRVGKDLDDSWANFKNLVKDIGFGGEIRYVDKEGNIKNHNKVGLLKTFGNFFKNIASGITLGAYTPNNEEAPVGAMARIKHIFKKVFVQAIGKDLLVGVSRGMIQTGEDAAFASLNLMEIVPDATIGNTKFGRAVTTAAFDDLQVGLDFATDIMPGGEGYTRARSLLVKGIKKGLNLINDREKTQEDSSEQYVRTTPFRRAIEAISFLIPFRF